LKAYLGSMNVWGRREKPHMAARNTYPTTGSINKDIFTMS
tara:strand:+ start:510 stop:629 length:120 start_codon:yes stop_codon:yes gene_type:complete